MTRRRIIALVAAGVLSLAGCTLPGEDRPDPVAQSTTATPGGTLRVGITPPGGVEPAAAYEPAGMLVSSTACMTLVNIDAETGELRPGLAESWVVSDGGASVLFKLREGMTFSDGSRLDSRAVVNSLRRLANPDTASYMADLLQPIAGWEEYRRAVERGDLSGNTFRGVRVNEPLSFEILFNGTSPDFVRTLAHPATAPVHEPSATRDAVGFTKQPVCAGPYRFDQPFEPGDTTLTLVRNERFAIDVPAFTRDGQGWADRIEFRVFVDSKQATEAFARGEIDVAPLAEGLPSIPADEIVRAPGSQVEYIGLPYGETSPFNEVRVRRALSAAIDRDRLVSEVYGGARAPATGFLPPVVGEAHRASACALEGRVDIASPEEVRAALGEEPVPFWFNDEFAHRRLVEHVAASWRAAFGVDVRPSPLNWDQYLQKATTGSGFDGAFRVSWSPKVASPVSYVEPLFSSSHIGNTNLQRFRSAELDETLRKDVIPATEEGDRIVLLKAIEDDLCRALPLIPIAFSQSSFAVRTARIAAARDDGRVVGAFGLPLLLDLSVKD